MTHLFLFTIGPVQGFIAQARKTLDLKAGSDILSQLILEGITLAKDKYSAEIIFPHLPKSGKSDSMPNKFLAQVEINSDQAKEMGKVIEEAVRSKFEGLATQSLQKMGLTESGDAFLTRFFSQIREHLEVYWVFEPLSKPSDFFRAYREIESNLGAIKNTRTFTQLEGEDGRKCSVSGDRDALIFSKNATYIPAFVLERSRIAVDSLKGKESQLPIGLVSSNDIILSAGEGLSAVVATKRFSGSRSNSFMSTAEIATLNFVNELKETDAEILLNQFLMWNHASDGQLLFPENHRKEYLNKQGYTSLAKNLTEVKADYRKLINYANKLKISRPKPYYALLTFDGDKMGATWSGDGAFLKDSSQLKAFQEALAHKLFEFAEKARKYLDDGKGQTVYAGGDDFTGFVNLHYLFEVLTYLRNLYQNEVSNQLREYLPPGKELTFSAGICIAHYKNPLGEVVRSAHKAQDYAKEEGGRNAFAIYLMKRSGEIQQATMKWGNKLENLKALQTCTELMQQGCFSNTFIQVLNQEIMSLVGREKKPYVEFDYFEVIVDLEANRLVRQSKIEEGIKKAFPELDREGKEDLIKEMQNAVKALFHAKNEEHVENFLHTLEISDFLNRQPDHAI